MPYFQGGNFKSDNDFQKLQFSNLSEILHVPYSECVYFKSGIGF